MTNIYRDSSGAMPGSAPEMMGRVPPGYHLSEPTCSPPASLSGSKVQAILGDMRMTHMMGGTAPLGAHMILQAIPTIVPAGRVSLVVYNLGWRTHEVVVLPLSAGAVAGQRVPGANGKVDESGSVGEVSGSCSAGRGDGIAAGSVGWSTLTLTAGRYELVCNEPNHYADGMYAELDVQ
jgi:uncharacterized cupredoxin-like copper-binding protein